MDRPDLCPLHAWRKGLTVAVIRKLRCRVEKVVDHGSQVYSLELAPERGLPAFKPGQFLHLALDEYDPSGFWPDSRAFSIASPPEQKEKLRIAYSVRGVFTARMERELCPGKAVWVKLPYGDFVIDNHDDVVLVAGGTGMTAFIGWLEALPPDRAQAVDLFYGARSLDLLIERAAVAAAARRAACFHPHYFVETPPDADPDGLNPQVGRLSVAQIWNQLAEPTRPVFYLSGPPAMLKAFSAELAGRGVAPERIRVDAWE
jgi:NAD(P)H-flavin reductase